MELFAQVKTTPMIGKNTKKPVNRQVNADFYLKKAYIYLKKENIVLRIGE